MIEAGVYSVQKADAACAPLLAALHAPCFPEEAWSAEALAALLESPGVFGLIAADTDRVALGFILARIVLDEGEVLTLAVPPALRRRGVGGVLLGAAITWLAASQATNLFLEVAEDNPAARALYRGAGFRRVGRRPGYYQRAQGAVAALVLERAIAADSDDRG